MKTVMIAVVTIIVVLMFLYVLVAHFAPNLWKSKVTVEQDTRPPSLEDKLAELQNLRPATGISIHRQRPIGLNGRCL